MLVQFALNHVVFVAVNMADTLRPVYRNRSVEYERGVKEHSGNKSGSWPKAEV